jgi:hypothetical protein
MWLAERPHDLKLTVPVMARDVGVVQADARLGGASDDRPISYGSFPTTWMASGVELAMESARVRHDQSLNRPTQVYIFSDYLPYHRLLRNWLIELKIECNPAPLAWLPGASTRDLKAKLPASNGGERRVDGLYVGNLRREDLQNGAALNSALERLAAAFTDMGQEFLASIFRAA